MITGRIVDGVVELTAQQGTTWEYELELFQDEDNTIPFTLTDYLARGQYRKDRHADSKLLIEFNCTVPEFNQSTNPYSNKVQIRAEAAQSSLLNSTELRVNNQPVLKGVFDVEIYQIVNAEEVNVMRPVEGNLIVKPEVTR